MEPGATITPGTDPSQQPTGAEQSGLPTSDSAVSGPVAATPVWQNEPDIRTTSSPESEALVSWTASEYIDHPKGSAWFMAFGIGLGLAVIVIYLLTRSVWTPVMIALAGMSFGVFAARKPRVLRYQLADDGLIIERKFYPYSEFRSFAVMSEGIFQSILLTPLKRFMAPLTVYFDPKDADAIVNTLAVYLPLEAREHDPIDQLMRRLRF